MVKVLPNLVLLLVWGFLGRSLFINNRQKGVSKKGFILTVIFWLAVIAFAALIWTLIDRWR